MVYRRGPPESESLRRRVLEEARREYRQHAMRNLEMSWKYPYIIRPTLLREISLYGNHAGDYRLVDRMRDVDRVERDPHREGDVHDIHTHRNRELSALPSEHDLLSLLFLAEREPGAGMSIHVLDHTGAEAGLNGAYGRAMAVIRGRDQGARDQAFWRIGQQIPEFADRLRHAGIVHVQPGPAFLDRIKTPKQLDPIFEDLIARRRVTNSFNDIVGRVGWPENHMDIKSWTNRPESHLNIRPDERAIVQEYLTRPDHAQFLDDFRRKHGDVYIPEIEEIRPFMHDPMKHMFVEKR